MSGVHRIVILATALVPIVATLGAPDPDALSRAVANVFRTSNAAPSVDAPVSRVDVAAPATTPLQVPNSTLQFQDASSSSSILTPDPRLVTSPPFLRAARRPVEGGRGLLLSSLYVSFATLQGLDAHSTILALNRGARETNAIVAPFADNRPALIALKAGTAAGVLYMTDRVARQNKLAGIVIMAAANSAYAMVVANNYRVASRLR
jgi:hypothetical protein